MTEEEHRLIRELHAQGVSRNETARRLGRSPEAVARAAWAMGLSYARAVRPIVPGERFGRLVVLEEARLERKRRGSEEADSLRAVRARCDCGEEKVIAFHSVAGGSTQSCGCLRREVNREQIVFRNQATRGVPVAGRKEAWSAVRVSLRKQPGEAARVLDEAEARGYLSKPLSPPPDKGAGK